MKTRRLVSVAYEDYRPFNLFTDLFSSFVCLSNPKYLEENDAIVLWGGGDISPSLYGQTKHTYGGGCPLPTVRDETEWNMLQRAKEMHLPIIGICRGAQMLCAAEGGYLVQDVDGHARGMYHPVLWADGDITPVNSLHHQMMVPYGNFELIAKPPTPLGTIYHFIDDKGNEVSSNSMVEPEFVYYPDILGFAIQWHPEMMLINAKATYKIHNFMRQKLNV